MPAELLIIDDSMEQIDALDSMLSGAGYVVRAARDGASGLRAARAQPPDLVLLDIMMPDRDGFKVCQQVRADSLLRHTPVIFVSSLHDVTLKAEAFRVGGSDYITKPFDGREVRIRVAHQLERVILRHQLAENARMEERQHIARELHDSVNQTLFILGASVQAMQMNEADLPAPMSDELAQLDTLAKSAQAEMRTLLNELRPAQMLKTPIRKLLTQLGAAFRLRLNAELSLVLADADLPLEIKLVFYRVAQEGLTNIAKHAGATRVSLHLLDADGDYRLVIADDGCGFDPSAIQSGIGLQSMRERAEAHGMTPIIESQPGQGTRIELMWNGKTP